MKRIIIAAALVLMTAGASAQDFHYSWKSVRMDASRTGVRSAGPNDVKESMGEVRGGKFYAPNGKVYKGSAAKATKALVAAQDAMSATKEVVGYSVEHMAWSRPENALGNFAVDRIKEGVEKAFGKKADVAITNFGGIRIDMPKGDVLKEDIISMFPFNNYLCYVTMSGAQLKKVFQVFADYGAQPLSGATVVLDYGRLVDVKVGGEPIDDERMYGVATIDFLLDGGDHFYIGENATVEMSTIKVSDCMLDYLKDLKARGGVIESRVEGRVTYLDNQ
ncbi:MAG: 5'-nucleotidase C-terminal domain-containing protein [Bacteroidales bacterium]|nr:5'-nucleotidase C-terminal domain-containing protein [Bacteroidales bacterium]